ncbi:hypothetical protein AXFE_19690 [Acidithrix ferrooxidans]|uniref:Uncharacterized protein n=1 Tax=Acidithrix ferrooxidans TaxID=1280514 RepID=A0A0D8HGN7_9ACTN|nr:hypothetical protein AXFE_19690 [Acidithrix ferrooxidans]
MVNKPSPWKWLTNNHIKSIFAIAVAKLADLYVRLPVALKFAQGENLLASSYCTLDNRYQTGWS